MKRSLIATVAAAVALLAIATSCAITEELIEESLDGSGAMRRWPQLAEAWLPALGASALLFGTGLLLWPGTQSLALVWPIGTYALTCGTCALAIVLRRGRRVGQQRR